MNSTIYYTLNIPVITEREREGEKKRIVKKETSVEGKHREKDHGALKMESFVGEQKKHNIIEWNKNSCRSNL